jgi:hypothetical protein
MFVATQIMLWMGNATERPTSQDNAVGYKISLALANSNQHYMSVRYM